MENGHKAQEEMEISRLLLSIMEGYSDKIIPPFSQLQEGIITNSSIEEKGSSSRKRGRPREAITVGSTQKERDRREKISETYALLQSMVPNLNPKATREKIASETISYIRYLKEELRRLEELKNSSSSMVVKGNTMSLYSNRNPLINVTVSAGNVAFFGIQLLTRRNLVGEIFVVFQKHSAEVLAANISVNHGRLTLTVTAIVNGTRDVNIEKIKKAILIL